MITRHASGDRMSLAVSYRGLFETAGIAAHDLQQDVQGQLRQVLAIIDGLMAEASIGKDQLTRVQLWLADYSHFDRVNEVYDAWLEGCPKPVRACVGADLGDGYLVEMQVFAIHQGSAGG
ncbi:Enamine deaminase RidA, house cleaning of reactive enamine intermediates, YjgF/YER057c/UK114 family [Pseudomonas guariconensis]|jgi:enamine deaminase RidA (YjgF/YER057c/UK114 family)|nr:Enamine deaminase RidA, house cleaning of reactive enamine intermediates, YjgF/YER057c/UK114 family [Pseudomonas guariconensis]